MYAKKKQPVSMPSEKEIQGALALVTLFEAAPRGIGILIRMMDAQTQAWYDTVTTQLEADAAAKRAAAARDRANMIRTAQSKVIAEKYREMKKINNALDSMTSKFLTAQSRATQRFIRRVYGDRVK